MGEGKKKNRKGKKNASPLSCATQIEEIVSFRCSSHGEPPRSFPLGVTRIIRHRIRHPSHHPSPLTNHRQHLQSFLSSPTDHQATTGSHVRSYFFCALGHCLLLILSAAKLLHADIG